MNYSSVIEVVTQVLLLSAIISLVVSVFTEFLVKKLFTWTTKVLNAFVTIASIALTVIVAVAYFQINSYTVYWYTWLAVVFIGFLAACISMNGYDKVFSYIYEWIKEIFNRTAEEAAEITDETAEESED